MRAMELIERADAAGVDLVVVDGRLKARGSPEAVAALAPILRPHRAELIRCMQDSAVLTEHLLRAAMRACDRHGDGAEARAQMHADVLATPPELREGLLRHFSKEPFK